MLSTFVCTHFVDDFLDGINHQLRLFSLYIVSGVRIGNLPGMKALRQTSLACKVGLKNNGSKVKGSIGWQNTLGNQRLKSKKDPDGSTTVWNYQNDTVICTSPNFEKTVQHYEAGNLVESKTFNQEGKLIAHVCLNNYPELNMQQEIQGDSVINTWMNTLGLPVLTQKGQLRTIQHYDPCGNCIASIDGEGRTTQQQFDPCGRMIKKILPDGAEVKYDYDSDSNLTACHLPGRVIWKATYDCMGRKNREELQALGKSTQRWDHIYSNGRLKEARDPVGRIRSYTYDSFGRLHEENIGKYKRTFDYNRRGQLTRAKQSSEKENSLIERSYDSCGRLSQENIFLNSKLLQQTCQTWEPSGRTLQIEGHQRDFRFEGGRLKRISTKEIDLSYEYAINGTMIGRKTPYHSVDVHYNGFLHPEKVQTQVLGNFYEESLQWNNSGKLSHYASAWPQGSPVKTMSYTARGHLKTVGVENYEFDFGIPGSGIRTESPDWNVPEGGLDPFGKILTELIKNKILVTSYDEMGQVTSRKSLDVDEQFKWDPWGRLVEVKSNDFTWQASYDAFGRRLQTIYKPKSGTPLLTTSLYDPEEEFQEIGVKYNENTFWKVYGPNSCDAIIDSNGEAVSLIQDALGNLIGVASSKEIYWNDPLPTPYGPLKPGISEKPELISFAKSFAWRSKKVDPTGFIWMGARYYDPTGGRFLSPDPVGYPLCLDLYAYANGDPINYIDPDGRFASAAYQTVSPVVIGALTNPRVHSCLRAVGGFTEATIGAGMALATAPTGIGVVGGFCLMAHGFDNFQAGLSQAMSGEFRDPATVQLLQMAGMSPNQANFTNDMVGVAGSFGGIAFIRNGAMAAPSVLSHPTLKLTESPNILKMGMKFDLNQLSQAASTVDCGAFTLAGRSLTKHGVGVRQGNSLFPLAKGNPKAINVQAQNIVDDILTTPGSIIQTSYRGRFGITIEVTSPNGQGIVYDANGKFLFFKE